MPFSFFAGELFSFFAERDGGHEFGTFGVELGVHEGEVFEGALLDFGDGPVELGGDEFVDAGEEFGGKFDRELGEGGEAVVADFAGGLRVLQDVLDDPEHLFGADGFGGERGVGVGAEELAAELADEPESEHDEAFLLQIVLEGQIGAVDRVRVLVRGRRDEVDQNVDVLVLHVRPRQRQHLDRRVDLPPQIWRVLLDSPADLRRDDERKDVRWR
jgi:hypothetical protein